MQITKGIIASAQKVVLYGVEGVGKSTFAANLPSPLYIDTEGSTKHLDVARLQRPTSWSMLLAMIAEIKRDSQGYKTLVIDTADWAEMLCIEHVCAQRKMTSIDETGLYGRGYVFLAEEFGRFLNQLSDLTEAGINVCLCAHAAIKKFEQPDEAGAYDRYELKLQKKTAALVKEWADLLLFMSYKTIVITKDKKAKASGQRRVMYASHHASWDAKNRHGLPDEMELDFSHIAHIFSASVTTTQANVTTTQPVVTAAPVAAPEPVKQPEVQVIHSEPPKFEPVVPDHLKPLYDLMRESGISEAEIVSAVANKGYFPVDTPIENYPADFVNAVLIAAWPQVKTLIEGNRPQTGQIPFTESETK